MNLPSESTTESTSGTKIMKGIGCALGIAVLATPFLIQHAHEKAQAQRLKMLAGAARAKIERVVGVDNVFRVTSDGVPENVKVMFRPHAIDEMNGQMIWIDHDDDNVADKDEPQTQTEYVDHEEPDAEQIVREVANPASKLHESTILRELKTDWKILEGW